MHLFWKEKLLKTLFTRALFASAVAMIQFCLGKDLIV